MTTKLNLITKSFEGATVRAVDHPEHGELLMGLDMLRAIGYAASGNRSIPYLNNLLVPREEWLQIARSTVADCYGSLFLNRGAVFLTRKGVNYVLMASDKPKAQAFRDWLAGDVVNAIVDTGGYLLNEAARDTAKADTRTSVPLPEEIGGAYAALIEARKAELVARINDQVARILVEIGRASATAVRGIAARRHGDD